MQNFVLGQGAFERIVIRGQGAESFLQGQLTCDVAALEPNSWTFGACCNNKGRVLATFVLVRLAESFQICLSRGLGETLEGNLRKYIPFYKCSMELVADQCGLVGLAGTSARAALATFGQTPSAAAIGKVLVHAGTGQWFCWLGGEFARGLWFGSLPSELSSLSLSENYPDKSIAWEGLGLLNGHFPFAAHHSGEYTPQELNLDQAGYVNFNKGCYSGQEIVARLHFRGKPKHVLHLVRHATGPETGGVCDSHGSSIGTAILSLPWENDSLTLIKLPVGLNLPYSELRIGHSEVTSGAGFGEKVNQLASFVSP